MTRYHKCWYFLRCHDPIYCSMTYQGDVLQWSALFSCIVPQRTSLVSYNIFFMKLPTRNSSPWNSTVCIVKIDGATTIVLSIGLFNSVNHYQIRSIHTLSACVWLACIRVFSTTSKYFLNSGPTANATSPKTDRICGLTYIQYKCEMW